MTRAALLNWNKLNFDGRLSVGPIEREAELRVYDKTESAAQVIERAEGCRILISKEQLLGKDVLKELKSVKLICEAGTGIDNIYPDAKEEFGIEVRNVAHYSTNDVAQLTMTFIGVLSLGLHRVLRSGGSSDLAGSPHWLQPNSRDLTGKVLGVVGAGAIGARVTSLARAFGMNVLVNTRSEPDGEKDSIWLDPHVTVCDLERVLEESHYLTLHCPLTQDTEKLIGPGQLARMRTDAGIVNTSRGRLIDQDALRDWLRENPGASAALDVQDPEPPLPDDALWSMENVVLTNHQGWKTIEARERLIARVADVIREYLKGAELSG